MTKIPHNSPPAASPATDTPHHRRGQSSSLAEDIAALEASLLADIEAFDLDAAEHKQLQETLNTVGGGLRATATGFPEIAPSGVQRTAQAKKAESARVAAENVSNNGDLLTQLRQQATARQAADRDANARQAAQDDDIDRALRQIFQYLHELTQQLNILKPSIGHDYPIADQQVLCQLVWQEGFADYRTQDQASGSRAELVSLGIRLGGAPSFCIKRDGPAIERFRTQLFDWGIRFECREFHNERRYVERAEFEISGSLNVNIRWQADFVQGRLLFEARNLERLGTVQLSIRPAAIDQALLEELGRLLLGQRSRFRELARR